MADSTDGSWAVSQGSDGLWNYRASALGSCQHALALERCGFLPVKSVYAPLQQYFDAGNAAEPEVHAELRAQGWHVHGDQDEVVLNVGAVARVVGHIDGRIHTDADPTKYLLEIKNMGETTLDIWNKHGLDGFPRYQWQVSAYMHATKLPLMMIVKPRNGGPLRPRVYEEPPISLGKIVNRVLTIENKHAELHTCELPRMSPCPFKYMHDDEPETVTDDPDLDLVASTYDTIRRQESDLKKMKDDSRDQLKTQLQGASTKDTISWSVGFETRTRTTFDAARFQQDHPDLYSQYMSTTSYEAVSVKRRG